MNEPIYLVVWLTGLFGLIGFVIAAVARLVRRDSIEYDRRFVWKRDVGFPVEEKAEDDHS
jgi:hypothetical protein